MASSKKDIEEDEEKKKLLPSKETLKESLAVFKYVRPYMWYLIIGLVLLAISSVVFLFIFKLFQWMIDAASGDLGLNLSLYDLGWIMLIVLVLQGIVSYFRVILFAHVSEKATADLRKALYNKIISLPLVFFEENRTGELVSRLTDDVEKLYAAFSITLAEFVRQLIILIGGIIFLAFTTWKLTLLMVATFPVIVVCAMFFGKYIRKLSRERQKEVANANIHLSESVSTIQVVKSFSNENFESGKYRQANHNIVSIAMKFARGRALFSSFIVTFLFGAICFILFRAALMLQAGTITSGSLVAFVSYTAIIGGAIAGLGNFYTQLLGALGATERLREILEEENEVNMEDGHLPAIELHGDIAYENIHFSYPTRDDIPVMNGLSMDIKAGQKIALVGASGAGKSTIVQLLMRFYDLQKGAIKVDGQNIKDYNITQYRKNIAIVPQEVLLFGGTIRENILYGNPDASEAAIMTAAKQSNAWEFIENFPEQMETIVGERGIKLSGGQRQRIAIARAILRNPSILILDEATSSLDAESEKIVQEALDKLMEGRTSIIIAHRLATIREVDCIYVIDKGKIIEKGTHEELTLLEDGAYNSLAKLQFETI